MGGGKRVSRVRVRPQNDGARKLVNAGKADCSHPFSIKLGCNLASEVFPAGTGSGPLSIKPLKTLKEVKLSV